MPNFIDVHISLKKDFCCTFYHWWHSFSAQTLLFEWQEGDCKILWKIYGDWPNP